MNFNCPFISTSAFCRVSQGLGGDGEDQPSQWPFFAPTPLHRHQLEEAPAFANFRIWKLRKLFCKATRIKSCMPVTVLSTVEVPKWNRWGSSVMSCRLLIAEELCGGPTVSCCVQIVPGLPLCGLRPVMTCFEALFSHVLEGGVYSRLHDRHLLVSCKGMRSEW